MTFLAALSDDRIDAPWLIDGPIIRERFLLYVETFEQSVPRDKRCCKS